MTQEQSTRSDANRKQQLRDKDRGEEAVGGEGMPSKHRKTTGSGMHEPQSNSTEMRDDGYPAGASGRAPRRTKEVEKESTSKERMGNEGRAQATRRNDRN